MRIHLIAAGTRMPSWVTEGFQEYAGRLPQELRLELHEIALGRRSGRNPDIRRAVHEEGVRMLAAVPKGAAVIALEVTGQSWSTEMLAESLNAWLGGGRDICLLVGGPDGLAPECLARADRRWSLSPLTLPHALVRIVLAEQIYRAWSLLNNHPYHRA